jgi:DNA-binding transcriptional LysR family regulator
MTLELKRLRYFLRIAEEGSLGRASTALGIAQPALSRQMRMLESEFGASLFNRTRNGMQLTEEGAQLRAAIAGPLRLLELATHSARSSSGRLEYSVAIGLPPMIAYVLGQALVERLAASMPNIKLNLVEDHIDALADKLLKGEIDLAFLYGQLPDDRLFGGDVLIEDLVLVGSANVRLSPDEPVTFGTLAAVPLVLPHAPHGMRSLVEKLAVRENIKLDIKFETDSFQTIKDLVISGFGYGILPLSSFLKEYESGALTYATIANADMNQRVIMAIRPHFQIPRSKLLQLSRLLRDEIGRVVERGRWPVRVLFPSG